MSEDETDRLADVWQRLAWANRDGEAFSDGCKWFRENGSYAIHVQSLAEHRWEARFHRFISDEDESELFVELSRLLGSFLDHSRAVLNYATYQLACSPLSKIRASRAASSLMWWSSLSTATRRSSGTPAA